MRFLFLIVIVLIGLVCTIFFQKSTNTKYGLITHGYGIVTDDDLAYDRFHRIIVPYNPDKHTGSLYWQCFPKKNVTVKYSTWRDNDPMGAWNIIIILCTPEIIVQHNNELQIYGDRRAHPFDYCRDFVREWKKLTKNENIVCLNGDGGNYSETEGQKYKYWTWEKFKTRKGCNSYFDGQCETLGYSKKKF